MSKNLAKFFIKDGYKTGDSFSDSERKKFSSIYISISAHNSKGGRPVMYSMFGYNFDSKNFRKNSKFMLESIQEYCNGMAKKMGLKYPSVCADMKEVK